MKKINMISKFSQIAQIMLTLLLVAFFVLPMWSQEILTTVILPTKVTQMVPEVSNKNDQLFEISGIRKGRQRVMTAFVQLEYNLNTIPENAIVDSWGISVYLAEMGDESKVQTVKMNLAADPNTSIAQVEVGSENLNAGSNDLTVSTNGNKSWLTNQNGKLAVQLRSTKQNFKYYTTPYTVPSNFINKQPRLVINYYMPPMMAESNWPQAKNNPQHTGQSIWKSNVRPSGMNISEVVDFGNSFMMGKPVIYDGLLVFHYQDASAPKFRMVAYGTDGQLVMSNNQIEGVVNFQPAIDHKGRLYCVVANSTLKILNLNNRMSLLKTIPLKAQVRATPVIGYDGSIYLSTKNGIHAYTPLPDVRLKWKYSSGDNRFGSVALSEDEKTVYVINGETGKLLALNNKDGSRKWAAGNFLGYKNEIPVPQVKGDRIIALDGIQKGKRFSIIDASGRIVMETNEARTEIYSLAAIGTKYAYMINDKAFNAYSLTDGTLARSSYIIESLGLNPASSLVVDGNDLVFVLNFEDKKQALTVFDGDCNLLFNYKLPVSTPNLADEHLVLAPDGNLFTDSRGKLFAFKPVINQKDVNLNAFRDHHVYRAGSKLNVQSSTLEKANNVILYSGKTISFQPGFKVQQGAKLTCKIGY
ncbi:MAG: hypothetical protein DWQ02_00315 [Bacteroidetes bacterium]|nr:MAG: hypothetical protein DWQ02_00315 [Bacteroidota bacterium]